MELQPHDQVRELFEALAAHGHEGRLTVRLRGASDLSGTLGPTGEHAVVLKAIGGREFFDAYVRYDAITCVEVQTRS